MHAFTIYFITSICIHFNKISANLALCRQTNVWSIRRFLTSILAYIAFTFAVSLLSHGHAARITRVALNCSTRWFTKDSEELRCAKHDVASQRLRVERKQSRNCSAKLLVCTIRPTGV